MNVNFPNPTTRLDLTYQIKENQHKMCYSDENSKIQPIFWLPVRFSGKAGAKQVGKS